ncbi:MAG: RIP metalloprotease RseP [Alkalispirochaeta sp.]
MLNVLIGLLGLGLVIFVHEMGHLIAAKMNGVRVEAFSVGWGKKIFSFQRGGTDYRISWLPIGGYCKMQGEHALLQAWQNRSSRIDVEEGDFYAAAPWRRIVILFAGPLVNFVFAVIVLAAIAIVGYTIQTFPNRIVRADEFGMNAGPAAEAGFETGDRIVAINGEEIESFRDLQTEIGQSAQQELEVTLERDGQRRSTTVVPELNTQTGAGRIGVFPWVEPVIAEVASSSAAEIAGIQPGDRILAVNDTNTPHSIAVERALSEAGSSSVELTVARDGATQQIRVVPDTNEQGTPSLGVAYETMSVATPQFGLFGGIAEGVRQAIETLQLTIRGIGLLFAGVDLNQALMGPVRITYMVGEIATAGAESGLGRGIFSFFNFLSLISITLFFMNLLPIPVLDGGQIVLSLAEMVRRKPIHPRVVYHYQVVGNVIVLGLMFFALFNDILFFARG